MVVRVAQHLLGLVLERAGRLAVEILDRAFDARALVEQRRAETLGVQRQPFFSALVSRRSACAGPRPSSATTLSRDAWPATSERFARGTSSASARSVSTASFARPSSGGSATRT